MIYDVIIIGLGASGVSASIYAKRSGLNIAVINFGLPGGIIGESSVVENYPGFKSITGMELAINFFEHFNSLDIPLFSEEVVDISIDDNLKIIKTNSNVYKSKYVIVCSGRKPKKLGLENEGKFIGKGISYCATCDANLYKDKITCVIGGGNSALESVLYLSDVCKKVYLIVRKDKVIGEHTLLNKILSKDNVEIKYNSVVSNLFLEDDKIKGVIIDNNIINVDGIFVNIGYEPSINILKNLDVDLDKNYILVDKNMETSINGIYACGDIIKKDLYQLVTAVSDGAIAATHIYKSLKTK